MTGEAIENENKKKKGLVSQGNGKINNRRAKKGTHKTERGRKIRAQHPKKLNA